MWLIIQGTWPSSLMPLSCCQKGYPRLKRAWYHTKKKQPHTHTKHQQFLIFNVQKKKARKFKYMNLYLVVIFSHTQFLSRIVSFEFISENFCDSIHYMHTWENKRSLIYINIKAFSSKVTGRLICLSIDFPLSLDF